VKSYALETEFAPAGRASATELRRQISRFSARSLPLDLLDALPIGVMFLNRHRQIVYANRPLVQTAQVVEVQALYGMRPGEGLQCIHAFERNGGCGTTRFCRACGAVRAIQTALLGKQAIEECRILRNQNGRVEALDLRVWTTPIKHEQEPFIMLALMDICHEKRRQALECVFFHDIINTASILQLAAAMVSTVDTDELLNTANVVQSTTARLIREINAHKDLVDAENGELVIEPVPLQSGVFLRQMVETYTSHPVAQGRLLCIAPETQDVEFFSDPALMGRVVGNMIKNALEACQPGQTVTVGCKAGEKEIEFWVHNPGFMAENVQLEIFHRSFSTKGRGRGLGAYSMRLLSERYLQGQVSFTSCPESGTTFVGRYPLKLDVE
jgi:signal transduction histidine kinase